MLGVSEDRHAPGDPPHTPQLENTPAQQPPGCTPAGTAARGRALSLPGVDPRSIPRVSPHPRPAPSVATPILLHPIPRGPPPLTPKFAPSHTHGPSVPAGPQPTPLLPQGPASLPPGSLVSAPERRPGLPLPPHALPARVPLGRPWMTPAPPPRQVATLAHHPPAAEARLPPLPGPCRLRRQGHACSSPLMTV